MKKVDANLQEVSAAEQAAEMQPAETVGPAQEASASEQEMDQEPEPDPEPIRLVVLAHPGTEALVERIWKKQFDLPFRVLPFRETDSLVSLLEDVMAMADVDRVFSIIPANLVPCAPVRWSDLQLPRADQVRDGVLLFWGRVPVCFNKDILVDFLPENGNLSDEEFVKRYLGDLLRPELVSHSYGNYFTKVLRGNPCEAVVIEGLMRKRFIYANAAGWAAVADLLTKALL